MKTIYLPLIFLFSLTAIALQAQDFSDKISTATASYQSGNLEDARFNLQQALADIDAEIGKEILSLLPSSLGEMASKPEEDDYSGSNLGFAGLYVHRIYGNQEQDHASLEIITDSPLLTGINAILSLPTFMNKGDENQKVIKVENYKALMQKTEDTSTGATSYTVQLPFGQSLLTLSCNGSFEESQVLALTNTIPFSQILDVVE